MSDADLEGAAAAAAPLLALTLWEPWATLVAQGCKGWETRPWSTLHRGPLAIHSSRRYKKREMWGRCGEPFFRDDLPREEWIRPDGSWAGPLGAIIAVVDVIDVRPTRDVAGGLSERELAYGNYDPGRYAWSLRLIGPAIARPVPCRGLQGLWKIPLEARLALAEQLS